MKTIELKWIEDDNHTVAEDAYTGMKELIDTGVFPNLEVECKDDTLYITGEQEDLDKAVMKIQKAYAKYGQIMIKEAKSGETGLRIESFDDNVQDIFNHTLADYQTFKESTKGSNKPANYITTLGDFQLKFKKFKDTAKGKDKKYMDGFLKEIAELSENYEPVKIKPIKKIDEGKLIDADALNVMMELIDLGYQSEAASRLIKKYTNFINKELKDGAKPYWIAKLIEDDMVNQQFSDKNDKDDEVDESTKINEDSLDDFDDREIKSRIAAQSEEVKKFVDEQQNLIYNYVKNIWISLCEKYKIDRTTYYEVTCDTSFGNGQEPGSTFFMLIEIKYLKQFLNAINARKVEEAEKWLYTKFCSDDCPFKISPAWKPEIYNSGDYQYRIRMGFIIPEYTPKKPRKPRKPRDPNKGYKKPDYVNPNTNGGTYFDGDTQVYEMPEDNESYMIKTAKEICESAGKRVINPETIDTCDDVEKELQKLGYGPAVSRALVKDNLSQIIRLLGNGNSAEDVAFVLDKQYMNEDANNDVRKHLSNPRNWGIIEEKMSRFEYNDKFEQVARMYAEANDIDDEDELYNELMDNDELPEWIDSDLSVYEIVYDKLMNESTKLTESLLSPSELKKKLTRVAAKWAYETGKSYEEAFNELRKKKSVKDMLDYYSVEEIIDDLKKKKKEVDDELEEEI